MHLLKYYVQKVILVYLNWNTLCLEQLIMESEGGYYSKLRKEVIPEAQIYISKTKRWWSFCSKLAKKKK